MKSKYKEIERDKNIRLNKYNENNELTINEYKNKKDTRFNYTFNILKNDENKINISLNNKENTNDLISTKKANEFNFLNNSEYQSHFKSNSLINGIQLNKSSTDKNKTLIDNIRHNKYLIPMIQKKNIEKKLFRSKFLEAPTNIIEFLSQVRQKTLKKRANTEKNKSKNKKNDINRKSNSSDKTNNNSSCININKSYKWKSSNEDKIRNDYLSYKLEDIYFPYLTENKKATKNYNIVYKPKKIQIVEPYNSYNYMNNNGKESKRDYKYESSLTNKEYTNDNFMENNKYKNYYKNRVIYPKIKKDIDNFKNNYYLKNLNIQGNNESIKIDFEQYFQNKKLFLIYRAKLFKLLYKSLSKIFNKYSIQLKFEFFQIIKANKITNKVYKQKILERLYPRKHHNTTKNHDTNINNINYDGNNNRIEKKLNFYINVNSNNIKNKIHGNIDLNNSMNTSKSCIQIIKKKNMSESKKKEDISELCRNLNDLKEKYDEIKIRKNFRDSKLNNLGLFSSKKMPIFIKNKNIYIRNKYAAISKGIYKRKKLDDFSDNKDKHSYNTSNISMKYLNSDKKNNISENKYIYNNESIKKLYKKKFNNNKNEKDLNNNSPNEKINKSLIVNRANNLNKKRDKNILNNKNKQKDFNNSNKYYIKKMIKNIQSSDRRLFVNINYVYLSNIIMKGKKEKYNNNILNIVNSDNFSLYKNTTNNLETNSGKFIGIIEEEESSNFNNTHDSNNSNDLGNNKKLKNKSSNTNSLSKRTNTPNDKYMFSCINFIWKTMMRVILKNSFNFFKKRINFEK